MAIAQMIGARIQRREDPRLVTGRGQFVDDVQLPGMLHMAIVRSPHPHARINGIDVGFARQSPGVVGVYTAADLATVLHGAVPVLPVLVPDKKQLPEQPFLATDETVYQGQPIAITVASDRYQAIDAASLVEVDYEPLPAVVDLDQSLRPESASVHTGARDNVGWDASFPGGDVDAAFAAAELTLQQRIVQQRVIPLALEGRAAVAEYRPFENRLTLWTSTQVPHFIRHFLSSGMGLPEAHVRVIAPDVGGAFGSKIRPYPEEYLVAAASRLTGLPVKWTESRTENLQATTHGRGQVLDVEVAAKRDGTLLAMKVTQYLDVGAYHGFFGSSRAITILVSGGCYQWQAIHGRSLGVLTNKVSTDPYRGDGRPEATHLVERTIDLVARELGMDPVEIRRKNFIREFPHTNLFGLVYDSGDYEKVLNRTLEIVDYKTLRTQQRAQREQGRYLGIGISMYVEICGFGPAAGTAPLTGGIALVESALVRLDPSGCATVTVGTKAHGQGHESPFAQLVADTLGVPYDSIEIRYGDTADTPFGYGTYGSRSLAVGGMAILRSCHKVLAKARQLAAHLLEADEQDLAFEHGRFHVKGSPERTKTLQELAFASYGGALPEDMEQGLEAVSFFDPPNFTWPFGCHVCVVEVDPALGSVDIKKYVAVDDCGNVINPMIVEGQIHGGVAQGIAQALFEEAVYDGETGQLKTGSLLDYLIPTANEIPDLELARTVTPSPTNELGVKGVGESGTIGASPAVINAICDALAPLGIKHVDMPVTPDRLWELIERDGRV